MMEAVVYFVGVSFYCPDPSRQTSILRLISWGGVNDHYAPHYSQLLSHLKLPLSYSISHRMTINATPEKYDRRHACEQFISLLRMLQSQNRLPEKVKRPEGLMHSLLRYFRPLSLLLKHPVKADTPPVLARMRAHEVYSSIACLLFININILDYSAISSLSSDLQSSPSSVSVASTQNSKAPDSPLQSYLSWLSLTMEEMLSFNCKAQVLMRILWYNGGDGSSPGAELNSQKNWLVFRMLWVCKFLESSGEGLGKVWGVLFDIVVRTLRGKVGGEEKCAAEMEGERWDEDWEDELRRVVLGEVYAGRPMGVDGSESFDEDENETENEREEGDGDEQRGLFEALKKDAIDRQLRGR
jgi:hypothetical protein